MNAQTRKRGVPFKGKSKGRYFSLTVKLIHTNELFPIKQVTNDMKIKELKSLVEFASGIPCHMQILCYLDEGLFLYTFYRGETNFQIKKIS